MTRRWRSNKRMILAWPSRRHTDLRTSSGAHLYLVRGSPFPGRPQQLLCLCAPAWCCSWALPCQRLRRGPAPCSPAWVAETSAGPPLSCAARIAASKIVISGVPIRSNIGRVWLQKPKFQKNFRHLHGDLNLDEIKNILRLLPVNRETNLMNLIRP